MGSACFIICESIFFSFICIRLESNYCYLKIIPLTNLRLNWLRSNKTHVISNQHPKIKVVVVVKTHLKFELWTYLAGNILGFFDWTMYVLMLFAIFKKILGGLYEIQGMTLNTKKVWLWFVKKTIIWVLVFQKFNKVRF